MQKINTISNEKIIYVIYDLEDIFSVCLMRSKNIRRTNVNYFVEEPLDLQPFPFFLSNQSIGRGVEISSSFCDIPFK